VKERHRRIVEQQEGSGSDEAPHGATIDVGDPKADRLEDERDDEREEGISAHRRGTRAAPSDRPEGDTPHPQDTNEIGEPGE
jgi:hypothetical protein